MRSPNPQSTTFDNTSNGNVVLLTDSNPAVVSTLDYTPFGTVLTRSGSYTPRFQFSSKEYDESVRLNYYGYRYYSPRLVRWLSRDPIGELGGYNVYTFVGGDPVQEIDPLGLSVFGNLPPPVQGPFKPPVKGGIIGGVCYAAWCTIVNYDDYLKCLDDCADALAECLRGALAKCPRGSTGPCYAAYAGIRGR